MTNFHRLLLLLFHHAIFASGSSSHQDVSSCCAMASGSCNTVCVKLSLVEIAADTELRDKRLSNVQKFCSSELTEFWGCMNQTIKEVVRGSGWWGRTCCNLAIVGACQRACATASTEEPLLGACRRSDEYAFFACLDRQARGQECCSNTQSLGCRDACRDIFKTRTTPTKEQRSRVAEMCEEHSPKLMQCVRNDTKVTPADNPMRYLHCCEQSTSAQCKENCRSTLRTKSSIQEIYDGLENFCGQPLPDDSFWQCFLRSDKATKDNEVSNIDRLGIDSAKLHCCHKAVTNHCKKLCLNTFTKYWVNLWERFDGECLKKPQERELVHCIEEVEEPCELGCNGLTYCSNFNNRPTELFRSCNSEADNAAHLDVVTWEILGYLDLPDLKLPLRNISKCSPTVWKTIACMLQIKPCSRLEHSNRICRDDCYAILSQCMDWSKVEGEHNAASLCEKLSPEEADMPCVSMQSFMEPSNYPYVEPYGQVSSPCKGDPCNSSQVCMINRSCKHGQSCNVFTCANGCPLGEVSQFLVPEGTYVRIPISNSQKGCQKICRCSGKGVIENCQLLPCISYDSCVLANKNIQHGSIFYLECNLCTCFAGEIVCSKKQCGDDNGALTPYTKLPCNCPPHHVPVCGSNGNTYPNTCLAKCAGLGDGDIEFGACSSKQVCAHSSCPMNTSCVPNPTVCLSLMHKPCDQYLCVNLTSCDEQGYNPVCDTDNITHKNPCHMINAGKRLAYNGECLSKCSQTGVVCAINGNTYPSECAAWAASVSVDYAGPCAAVGLISDSMGPKCLFFDEITCPPLFNPQCVGFTPPGACCPTCGGAIKLLYSRKQIDRALYALRGQSLNALTLSAVLASLQRHIQVAECVVRGYLTVELEIFVAVQSTEKEASGVQLEACVREAEKLAGLIKRHSGRIASELSLSALTVAVEGHGLPSSAGAPRISSMMFSFVVCLVGNVYFALNS